MKNNWSFRWRDDQIIKKPFAGERFQAKAGFDTLPSNESLLSFRFTLRGDWKFEYYLIVNIYLQLLLLFLLTIPSNLRYVLFFFFENN